MIFVKIVVKVGGSVSVNGSGPDFSYFSKLAKVVRQLRKSHQLIIAVGGGKLTRNYGKSVEKFALRDDERDRIFIQLIKANVLLASRVLGLKPIFSLDTINPRTSGVIGGIAPGRSTDANAALAARKIKAGLFVKMTSVGGIYNKDPNKFKGAKKINRMTFSDLKKFAVKGRPNSYGILDAMAIKMLAAARIKTVVISGKSPRNLLSAVRGARMGTVIE